VWLAVAAFAKIPLGRTTLDAKLVLVKEIFLDPSLTQQSFEVLGFVRTFCKLHVACGALTFTQCNVHMEPCELTSPCHRFRTRTRTTIKIYHIFQASSTLNVNGCWVYPTVHVQLDASIEQVRFFIARLIIMRVQLTPQVPHDSRHYNLQFMSNLLVQRTGGP
jgi:hypothetical protein